MLEMTIGKVGSGKSLLETVKALRKMARGGCVVTNIALNAEGVDAYLWRHFRRRLGKGQMRYHDFEEQPDFRRAIPRGSRDLTVSVVIDEAQLYYNAANDRQLKATLLDLVSYLTQSRKMGVDVCFVTQAPETIWGQFRYQCLFMNKCRDMRCLSVPLFGKIFSGLKYTKVDIWSGQVLETHSTKLHPDLFACYDTAQMYDSKMRDIGESMRRRGT